MKDNRKFQDVAPYNPTAKARIERLFNQSDGNMLTADNISGCSLKAETHCLCGRAWFSAPSVVYLTA